MFKVGYVGVIGFPNSGKSTLVNALIGEKVSIVSSKPQTTRKRIKGIATGMNYQMIFLDAPGIVKAQSGLNQFIQQEYESVIEESDILVATLNIDEKDPDKLKSIVELCVASNKPWIPVITKKDISAKKHRVQILKDQLAKYNPIAISSDKNPEDAKQILLEKLIEMLPAAESPLYFDDIYTTQNLREMCEEIVREKCFHFLHQEIPFGLAVKVNKFDESNPKLIKIYADIVLSKPNHQSIVIGEKASNLKRIGQSSRIEMENLLGTKVFLDLHVKVRKNWTKQSNWMKEFGYEIKTL
ncbi:MAG: GTPase Era [Bdellovibrionales bacterium]|nr:GTPase Era [Bdellovibrionales bacterium]